MSGCVLQKGQRVLIAAHGNSLRAMVKYLDNMTDEEIMALNIPTGEYAAVILIKQKRILLSTEKVLLLKYRDAAQTPCCRLRVAGLMQPIINLSPPAFTCMASIKINSLSRSLVN